MNSILAPGKLVYIYIYIHLNERYPEDNRTRFVAVVDLEVEDKLMLVGKVGEDR
jgi:hypothetical protein